MITTIKKYGEFVNENLNGGRGFGNFKNNKLNEGIGSESYTPILGGLIKPKFDVDVYKEDNKKDFPNVAKKGRVVLLSTYKNENYSKLFKTFDEKLAYSTHFSKSPSLAKWTIPYSEIVSNKTTKTELESIKKELLTLYNDVISKIQINEGVGVDGVNYTLSGVFNIGGLVFEKQKFEPKTKNTENIQYISKFKETLNSIVEKNSVFKWEMSKGASDTGIIPGVILNNVRFVSKDVDSTKTPNSNLLKNGYVDSNIFVNGILPPFIYAINKVSFMLQYVSDSNMAQYLYDEGVSKLQPTDFAKGEEVTSTDFVNLNKQNLAVSIKAKLPDNVAPAKNESRRISSNNPSLNEAKSCKGKVSKFLKDNGCEVDYEAGTCKMDGKSIKIEKALLKLKAPETLIKSYTTECEKEVNEALRLMRRR